MIDSFRTLVDSLVRAEKITIEDTKNILPQNEINIIDDKGNKKD